MIASPLEFLNKNLYRKYPIWSGSDLQTTTGLQLPLDLFSACRLSTTVAYAKLYISRIRVVDAFLSVTISASLLSGEVEVGVFNGVVNSDFQLFNLYAFYPFISGTLTTGLASSLAQFNGLYFMDYTNGRIEDSLVFCYPRPGVTGLQHNNATATGEVKLALTNISYTSQLETSSSSGSPTATELVFDVTDHASIASKADKASKYGTCDLPMILSINKVTPDSFGNINFIFVHPLSFTVAGPKLTVKTTMSLADYCPVNDRLPPDNPVNTYPNFLSVTVPEWQSWPNYKV